MSLKRPPSEEIVHHSKNIKTREVQERNNIVHLKRDLRSAMLVHADNSGDFATGGLLSDLELPASPLIAIENYGILSSPLTKQVFDTVKEHCQDSPYGLGEETIIDKSVRNSIELNPDIFKITNELFTDQISQLINDKIKPKLGLKDSTIYGKLYKLLIYESGGKFDEHRDTEKEDNMFGTLIIQLPSIFTGGNLVVKHNRKEKVYENSQAGSSTHCMFVAHYSSCLHKLEEINSGYRVALIYSLCWDGNGIKPTPYIASANTIKLCNLLNQYMDLPSTTYVTWGLEYEYSIAALTTEKGASSFFKGADKNVLVGLLNALAYDKLQYDKERYEVYIATAKKWFSETGNCGKEDEQSWDGCSGGSDCCGDFDIIDSSASLEEFVPLNKNTLGASGLAMEFSASMDLHYGNNNEQLRYLDSDSEEFWGSDAETTGCSGPTGNAGNLRERWYNQKVLVFWRYDRALALKCKSSMSDGINHVLQLIKHNELEEAKKGLDFLSPPISNLGPDDTLHLIEISTALKIKENIHLLFKNMQKWGISESENGGKVIGKAAQQLLSRESLGLLIELLKKCKSSKTINDLIRSFQPPHYDHLGNYDHLDLDMLVECILSIPGNNQPILCGVVAHVTSNERENLPDCLMKACISRLAYLEGIALKGKPALSWSQPNAIVPGHPTVEHFLRGPQKKLVYQNFNDIRHARNWLAKHRGDRGCYMNLVLGSAVGTNSYVEVVKTNEGYEKLLSVYHQEIAEYKRLVDVVPGYTDVTLQIPVCTNSQHSSMSRNKVPEIIILD